MFCNELVSDAADDGAAVPSASFSENEVVKLAKDPGFLKTFPPEQFFFLLVSSSLRGTDIKPKMVMFDKIVP